MSTTGHYAPNEWQVGGAPSHGNRLQSGIWRGYDIFLASVAILLSSDAINRFGVATPLWYMLYAMTLLRIAVNWRGFASLMSRNVLLFAYPAVCILSVAWSGERTLSLLSGIQLAMSVTIAMFIGARFNLRDIAYIAFWAIVITALLSLVNWATGIFGNVYAGSGGLLGIYTQKNALGQRCLVAIVAGVTLLLMARRQEPFLIMSVLGGLAILAFALNLSKSVTSILLSLPLVALLLVMSVHRLNRGAMLVIASVVVAVVAIAPIAFAVSGFDVVTFVLNEFGKDASLTGRTSLWEIAEVALSGNWLLGVGFLAFWRMAAYQNLVFLAQSVGGEAVLGFHNFVLEILVGTGIVGLVAMFALVGISLWRTIMLWLLTRDVGSAFGSIAIVTCVILSLLGTSLYRQHEFCVMIVVMLAVSAGERLHGLRRSATASRRST